MLFHIGEFLMTKPLRNTFNFTAVQGQIPSPGETTPGFFLLRDISGANLNLAGIVDDLTGQGTPNSVEVDGFGFLIFTNPTDATACYNALKTAVVDKLGHDGIFAYTKNDGRPRFAVVTKVGVVSIQDNTGLLPSPPFFRVNFNFESRQGFVTLAEAEVFLSSIQDAVENYRGPGS